jgi:2',3'-cyclic-nucleotide 2'-phosphodiesterase (5'-nucleotidase family)
MRFYIAAFFLLLIFQGCKTAYRVQKTEPVEYVLTDTTNNSIDSSVYKYILPYKEKLTAEMNVSLAESEEALERGLPESKLGDFVADACLTEASKIFYPSDGRQADFAFFNNGGLRRPLPKGKITRGDVYELMPFENELVVLTIDAALVKKISNFIASKDGGPVAGIRFRIKNQEATEITIHGERLDTLKTYKALTSDYLANGGDSFEFLIGATRERVNLKVRDALLQNLQSTGKEGKKVIVKLDGRISHAD